MTKPVDYAAAWENVDPDVRQRAVSILRDALSDTDKSLIVDAIHNYGHNEWIHTPGFGHHFFGMSVRNYLRTNGVKDAELPPFDAYYGEGTDVRNWDDYYLQAIEEAVSDV